MPQHEKDLLTTCPVGRLLFKLSIPSIIGLILQMAYSLTDTFFVSLWIGDDAVAALAVAFPIQLIMVAFAQGFGIGGATLAGKWLGSDDSHKADEVLKNTFLLTGISSVALSAVALLSLPLLLPWLGASPATYPMAHSYSSIVLLGCPFLGFSIAANSMARAEGNAATAMKTLIISSMANVILDPFFIKAMDLGISGAAWATVLAQAGSALWMGIYLRKKSAMRWSAPHFRIDLSVARSIMSIGSSALVRQGAGSVTAAFMNGILAALGGDPAVAAMGILGRITTLAYMPLFGLIQGMMPIVSHNLGAKESCRVLRAISLATLWGTVLCLLGSIPLVARPASILSFFSSGETLKMAIIASPYVGISMPLAGFQVVLSGTYQAMGDGKIAFLLDLTRRILVIVPLAWILSRHYGIMGVFWSFPLSEIASGAVSLGLFRSIREKLIKACLDDRP